MQIIHQFTLLSGEVESLRKANEELSRRRRTKKRRLRAGGSLTVQESQDLQAQAEVEEQVQQETRAQGGRKKRDETRQRRCGTCGKTGHNARTCQEVVETSEEEYSD
jgi:hypothetical protein